MLSPRVGDYRVKMEADLVARVQHAARRRDPRRWRRRTTLRASEHGVGRQRPRNDRVALGIDFEQAVDLIGLGLEFERESVARGEEGDQVAADARDPVEGE